MLVHADVVVRQIKMVGYNGSLIATVELDVMPHLLVQDTLCQKIRGVTMTSGPTGVRLIHLLAQLGMGGLNLNAT